MAPITDAHKLVSGPICAAVRGQLVSLAVGKVCHLLGLMQDHFVHLLMGPRKTPRFRLAKPGRHEESYMKALAVKRFSFLSREDGLAAAGHGPANGMAFTGPPVSSDLGMCPCAFSGKGSPGNARSPKPSAESGSCCCHHYHRTESIVFVSSTVSPYPE